MSDSKPSIVELEDEARSLKRQLAWASGERAFRLREKLAELEAHIRFLQSDGEPNTAQINLF